MNDDAPAVAELLTRLRAGDAAAAEAIFNRFARRLIGLARTQLDSRIRQKVDPEDVVQSVFCSFFVRQLEGAFTIRDESNLWSLLAQITVRKCMNIRVAFSALSRDLNRERAALDEHDIALLEAEALARDPTPAEAAALTEVVDLALRALPDEQRQMALLYLQGQDVRAISQAVNRAERTVRRNLQYFRELLEQALRDPSSLG
jgi:RNA polymerase sigma-70 factor (ECF subfamily)